MGLFVSVGEARRARPYDGGSYGSQSSHGRHWVSNKVQEALPEDGDSRPVDIGKLIGSSSLMQGKDRLESHVAKRIGTVTTALRINTHERAHQHR